MPQVALETVEPQLLAAVRANVEIKEIPNAWQPAIYAVKAFLAERPELAGARQVFLYHHPTQRQASMDIDFGIEVAQPFADEASVKCISAPGGRVGDALLGQSAQRTPHLGGVAARMVEHLGGRRGAPAGVEPPLSLQLSELTARHGPRRRHVQSPVEFGCVGQGLGAGSAVTLAHACGHCRGW